MNDKFVYDEKTSVLYAPDGHALKRVDCPKAMHWNQLTVQDGEERWRGCVECNERVVNLDVMDVHEAVSMLDGRGSKVCVHGSSESGRVIFLKDKDAIRPAADVKLDEQGRTVIQTARTTAAINRATNLGYWPDVRLVTYDTKNLHSKFSVGQHVESGRIQLSGDYRMSFSRPDDPSHIERKAALAELAEHDTDDTTLDDEREMDQWVEVVPFTGYYPYYQEKPIAAYLIPRQLADGSKLLIEDPIEDVVGATWNQGNAYRARAIPGTREERRAVLGKKEEKVRRRHRFVG